MMHMPKPGLYAITDCKNLGNNDLLEKSEAILRAGAVMLQFRNKDKNTEDKTKLAKELQTLCREYQRLFIINDDVELTRMIKADGIHLGQSDMDVEQARDILGPVIIGVSCYNEIEHAITAQGSGADYVALGTFYLSPTKPDAVRAQPGLINEVKQKINLPIVAIGGITPENGKQLIEAGADYLAAISGVYSVADSFSTTQDYVKLFNHND